MVGIGKSIAQVLREKDTLGAGLKFQCVVHTAIVLSTRICIINFSIPLAFAGQEPMLGIRTSSGTAAASKRVTSSPAHPSETTEPEAQATATSAAAPANPAGAAPLALFSLKMCFPLSVQLPSIGRTICRSYSS